MNSLVKMARLTSEFSIEEAAKMLNISAGYLSQIENGQRQVSSIRAEEIANLYKKSREEIFLPSRYAIREVDEQSSA
ncbi:helix-turn-helix domain-containing protein [Paenibacillus sp. WC2504]|uniref:helix-turn-helix domain-containing protein n=1 Tax=Paenibacillus sp. WC2504 TaxID=3461403 RepID=UPI00404646BF